MADSAVTLPNEIGKTTAGELLRLVGMPSETEKAAEKLGSVKELVRSVVAIIDDLVSRAVEQRTGEEFEKTRNEVFPQYFAALRSLGSLIEIVVPRPAIDRMLGESLTELEADFRGMGSTTIGAELMNRGMFTVWTLRKISDLATEMSICPNLAEGNTETNNDMAVKFATHAIWARFHVDCLVKSMRSKKPIYPGAVDPIINGLRAVVDAYAWLRQAVDLRTGASEPELAPIPWDEEDEALLADSMHDLR